MMKIVYTTVAYYFRFAWIILYVAYLFFEKKNKIVKCPFTLYNKSKRQQKQFEKKKEKMK